jgi:CheY-like chemotaxis protein
MLSHIPLDILIIDPEEASSSRLKRALAKYRKEGKRKLVGNLVVAHDLNEAQRVLEEDDINCVFIDSILPGLDAASEFIFRVRQAIPRIIFVLYNDSDRAEELEADFYRGERLRFLHYFKLNKKSTGEKLDRKLLYVIHLCMSDIRLQVSYARKQIADLRMRGIPRPPVEISESLGEFKVVFSGQRTAFIMMSFERSPTHDAISDAIKKSLSRFQIRAMRANDRQFHENLYDNIRTYMYGCDFGVAVIERISHQSINANISFEIGYMKGLKKPVCIMKDKTFTTIQADLLGTLYQEFDTYAVDVSVDKALNDWVGNLLERLSSS